MVSGFAGPVKNLLHLTPGSIEQRDGDGGGVPQREGENNAAACRIWLGGMKCERCITGRIIGIAAANLADAVDTAIEAAEHYLIILVNPKGTNGGLILQNLCVDWSGFGIIFQCPYPPATKIPINIFSC